MNGLHWSAVYPENPSPVAILVGFLPKSTGTLILFALFSINLRWVFVIFPPSIHNLFTIQCAIPKNKLCIGSTTRNLIRSKYGNLNNSDQRTWVSETCCFLSCLDLHSHQRSALRRCSFGSFCTNHSVI